MFILPGATVGVIASICSGMLITRFGPRSVMAAASVLGVLGFGSMIVAHEHAWQVVCASMLMCAFTSLSYASLPALLVAEVEPGLTGVANSVNSIARTVGSSVASALLATLLTTHTAAGVATVDAYLIAFAIGAGCAVAATLLVFLATAKSHRRRQAGAEAAPVG